MKILLISGHTSGHNKMGNGSRNEGDLNIDLVKLINSKLSGYISVEVYPYDRDAFKDVQNGVFMKYLPKGIQYCLEVHFNALNGQYNKDGKRKGSEIFVTTKEKGISVEQKIMKNLNKYFPLRDNDNVFDGVKRKNFGVINKLKSLGISGALLETCFYDDEDDMNVYYANKDAIADAIVSGIVEGFGLKKTTSSKPVETPVNSFLIKVANVSKGDVLNIRERPDADSKVVQTLDYNDPNKYTIVETCKVGTQTWGLLKSGMSNRNKWINLYYTKRV